MKKGILVSRMETSNKTKKSTELAPHLVFVGPKALDDALDWIYRALANKENVKYSYCTDEVEIFTPEKVNPRATRPGKRSRTSQKPRR